MYLVQIQWCFGQIQCYLGKHSAIWRQNILVFWANTFAFGVYTLVFWENTGVFGGKFVSIFGNTHSGILRQIQCYVRRIKLYFKQKYGGLGNYFGIWWQLQWYFGQIRGYQEWLHT